eukprot:GILK01002666.1.p1 GENE.GILK01002666.1~~GILK01002666.1.p1  ORF type:complete len:1084 (-),score=207.83 GILK01002666.1:177-3428(-)
MVQKAIREYHGKKILSKWLPVYSEGVHKFVEKFVLVTPEVSLDMLAAQNPWLLKEKLVAKPDQLIKRRGKRGLIALNVTFEEAKQWIAERMSKTVEADNVEGVIDHFIVEPFLPHSADQELYFALQAVRDGTEILFHHAGGVDVGDVDAKAKRVTIPIDETASASSISSNILSEIHDIQAKEAIATFICAVFKMFNELNFVYLEVNPLVLTDEGVVALDMACKLDTAAEFMCQEKWGDVEFPSPFGRQSLPEEDYIASLDAKTGASLKLTILNPKGRIWTMVAGGGASVIYTDTLADLGVGHEIANYGEYSGAPSEAMTYEYACTVLRLLTRFPEIQNKVLIIGGGIANFTNVAETFKGIIRAIREMADVLKQQNIAIFVRRGGPNYAEGLRMMKDLGTELSLNIQVYGPETHLTAIVGMAIGRDNSNTADTSTQDRYLAPLLKLRQRPPSSPLTVHRAVHHVYKSLFTRDTRAFVWGMQPQAIQGMLDFDHISGRSVPSVAAILYPFAGTHFQKFYWGQQEVLFPVFQTMEEALKKYPEVDVVVNFASFRSVFESTMDALRFKQIRVIAIIAEGVPEIHARKIIAEAHRKGVVIIGPATVGGIRPACFRIGNTGGMMDNVIESKLYRPGSVGYVARSGGMSNELNNIISRNSDGVLEGIAIGGDRYAGSTFIDHIMRFEQEADIKMIVLLGEVGGTDEYEVVHAIREGRITKPVVAWCIGTCAKVFPFEVQFGHAGALAKAQMETADAKNQAFREAGAVVPDSFDHFGVAIKTVYEYLVSTNVILPRVEPPAPKIPMDYDWARKLGLIRKPAAFVSTISDDRGEELLYAGMPISQVFEQQIGIGGVLSLLWFKRLLPAYACKFFEMVLMVTADHGPAVSGAHNTIVTARAGKDLLSSLVSGLLTIGPRFGGAIDGAAEQFAHAFDSAWTPQRFVDEMRKQKKLIMGIGHRVKSLDNPDMRVVQLKNFAKANFPSTDLLKFAEEVEKLTTQKKANLILNVDGCIGVVFVDLLRSCGAFTREEADEYLKLGCLNGLFVVGRSIGFIGHYLDQKRLKEGLYRHPWDDIAYMPADYAPSGGAGVDE